MWSTVCQQQFSVNDAIAICTKLGFTNNCEFIITCIFVFDSLLICFDLYDVCTAHYYMYICILAPRVLFVPDIAAGFGNIVKVNIVCTTVNPAESETCSVMIQDDVENRCSHINDIGIDCSSGNTLESNE